MCHLSVQQVILNHRLKLTHKDKYICHRFPTLRQRLTNPVLPYLKMPGIMIYMHLPGALKPRNLKGMNGVCFWPLHNATCVAAILMVKQRCWTYCISRFGMIIPHILHNLWLTHVYRTILTWTCAYSVSSNEKDSTSWTKLLGELNNVKSEMIITHPLSHDGKMTTIPWPISLKISFC